jgi:uncharacterized protein
VTTSALQTSAVGEPTISFGFGVTRHKRLWPKVHQFEVGSVFLRLPMRSIAAQGASRLGFGLFGLNKPSPLGFADSDHFERSKSHGSALAALDALLLREGITACTGEHAGEVWLHTFPRVMGYAFKPVSFWFCYDKGDASAVQQLRAVVAEVHNTFGEQHLYLLHHADQSPLLDGQTITAKKLFHVSPFFPVRGEYQFKWLVNAERSVVRIDYVDTAHQLDKPSDITLSTSISGSQIPIGLASCLRALLGYPLNSLMVLLRIHYQALWLWCKGARFYRLPAKPLLDVTHSQ